MFLIQENGVIKLTRGDTAYLKVDIVNDLSGEPYEMDPNDTLTLTVKRTVKDTEICFQKTIKGSTEFKIEPEDTVHCSFAKYKYDVQLKRTNGDVHTVVVPTYFCILEEVTC